MKRVPRSLALAVVEADLVGARAGAGVVAVAAAAVSAIAGNPYSQMRTGAVVVKMAAPVLLVRPAWALARRWKSSGEHGGRDRQQAAR